MVYYELTQNTQLFWKTYSDNSISFQYPPNFVNSKEIKEATYLCSELNKQGLDDCISYKYISSPFDINSIRTTGGPLPQGDLRTKTFNGKQFLAYLDGDATVFKYSYIHEVPDQSGYYEISFLSNDFSKWKIDQDINQVLSGISFLK